MNEFDENYAKYVEVQYGDKRDPVRDASMIAFERSIIAACLYGIGPCGYDEY